MTHRGVQQGCQAARPVLPPTPPTPGSRGGFSAIRVQWEGRCGAREHHRSEGLSLPLLGGPGSLSPCPSPCPGISSPPGGEPHNGQAKLWAAQVPAVVQQTHPGGTITAGSLMGTPRHNDRRTQGPRHSALQCTQVCGPTPHPAGNRPQSEVGVRGPPQTTRSLPAHPQRGWVLLPPPARFRRPLVGGTRSGPRIWVLGGPQPAAPEPPWSCPSPQRETGHL